MKDDEKSFFDDRTLLIVQYSNLNYYEKANVFDRIKNNVTTNSKEIPNKLIIKKKYHDLIRDFEERKQKLETEKIMIENYYRKQIQIIKLECEQKIENIKYEQKMENIKYEQKMKILNEQ